MAHKITRRQALLGASSALLVQAACTSGPEISSPSVDVFRHGIASGDPAESSIVLWTRISGFDTRTDVSWKVATDRSLRNVVDQGVFATDARRDFTVKVIPGGLAPGQSYFYQFSVAGVPSPLGQTKTLPTGHLDQLVIAVATCSNYPFGFFNAYEDIANDASVDIVAHLGDYIYEYSEDGYGGETGKRIGRVHAPTHEILDLADYRQRHAQYKTDPGSLLMHARHPMVAIWDDHESANNPWMGGAENHQADEGNWSDRRRAAMLAYFEWMPIRDPAAGTPMEQYWRHYKFGDLVSLITLESRHTGRSLQIDYGDLSRFDGPEAAQRFYAEEAGATKRNFLSAEMEQFLARELRESVAAGRRWRVIGNQSVMAKSVAPKLDDDVFTRLRTELQGPARELLASLTRIGALGVSGDLDSWDGYPAARERFYSLCKDAGAQDLLVISGDSHSYWANQLFDDAGDSMGLELGSTGISSPRSVLTLGNEGLVAYDRANAASNPEIVWTDGRHRGYIRLQIRHAGAQADFVAVSNVESRKYSARIVHTEHIENTAGILRYL